MATGAGDQYWGQPGLPSVFKHDLLRRYLPRFAGKTGSVANGVVYLDGYAGRGRYQDGNPASAERILQIAEKQGVMGINYRLFFYESNLKSYAILKPVVDEYVARGIQAEVFRSEVIQGLEEVIDAAAGMPLFLFLDPCGLGVPFDVLVNVLTGPRASKWPPTEVLLNFSLEAVRRIGGHVASLTPNERAMQRLDETVGGNWWRHLVTYGVTDEAVDRIVRGFMHRLSRSAQMRLFAISVERAPTQKPIYYLVFGTRNPLGLWHFADDTARATETWWSTLDAQEAAKEEEADLVPLFDIQIPSHPDISEVEEEARPVIAENLVCLCQQHGKIRVGSFPAEVFGDYLGRVRETVVRAAIKDLHSSGRTPSDGKGSPIANLTVSP
jgi:three-Cys-motif partner protein